MAVCSITAVPGAKLCKAPVGFIDGWNLYHTPHACLHRSVQGLPEVQASSRTGGTCKWEPPLVEKRLHVPKTRKMLARHSQLGQSHEPRDALRLLQLVCTGICRLPSGQDGAQALHWMRTSGHAIVGS